MLHGCAGGEKLGQGNANRNVKVSFLGYGFPTSLAAPLPMRMMQLKPWFKSSGIFDGILEWLGRLWLRVSDGFIIWRADLVF